MIGTNPIEFTAAGAYDDNCRILAIVWEGSTTAGDTVEIRFNLPKAGKVWRGRANDTNTYLGINYGPNGLHAPGGFRVYAISSGTLLVYLKEE